MNKEYTYRTVALESDPQIQLTYVSIHHDSTPDYVPGRMAGPPRVQFNFEVVNPSPEIFEILNSACLNEVPLALIPVEDAPEHVHDVRSDVYETASGKTIERTWCADHRCHWEQEPQR